MIKSKEFVKNMVSANIDKLVSINDREEMTEWLSAMIYTAIGFGRNQVLEEQQKIDIDKVCEIYRMQLSDFIYFFYGFGKELSELIDLKDSVKDFRDTLEEEL